MSTLLTFAFPAVFPLATIMPGKSASTYDYEHLMLQFNLAAQSSPPLLFLLANIKERHAALGSMSTAVKGNYGSIQAFSALTADPTLMAQVAAAMREPDAPASKKLA